MTDNSDAFDIIREIMNIGIGEAADALSKLINARVTIKIPDVRIMQTRDVHGYIRDALESLGVYISQDFTGSIQGKTILFYTKACSISLLNAVSRQDLEFSSLSESGIATLNEIGNIIMGSCISEISNMTESTVSFNIPEATVEISESYFQNLLMELDDLDKAIVIRNEMQIKEKDIQGYLFVLLSFEDFNQVIDRLLEKMKGV